MGSLTFVAVCLSLIAIKQITALPTNQLTLPPPQPERSRSNTALLEAKFQNGKKLSCTIDEENEHSIHAGIIPTKYRWQAFNVFIDSSYSSDERNLVNNAMYRLSQVLTCISFGIWPAGSSPSGDYVYIQKGNSCSSPVGKQTGRQNMTLASPGCMSIGTVMHEMIHALGFWHEQSRPDRDDYVTIQTQNIEPGKEHNFNKYSSGEVSTFGVTYDQRSIMHYGAKDFSKNGQPTIVAKNGGAVGSTGDLRESDKSKLKKICHRLFISSWLQRGFITATPDSVELTLPPPLPERSRLGSRFLESRINPNGTILDCTTDDDDDSQIQSGVISTRYRWENFNVFIASDYSSNERTLINNAMYRLSQVLPCVKFGIFPADSKPSGDYVNIKKGSGCSSSVGKIGGRQDLSLASPGCMSIGFHHEQCRPDRDDFVTIQPQNIEPGKEHNFKKYSSSQVSTYDVAYDQRSIMHYGAKYFSKNGQPTIVAKNGGSVGSTEDLRESDKSKLKNIFYHAFQKPKPTCTHTFLTSHFDSNQKLLNYKMRSIWFSSVCLLFITIKPTSTQSKDRLVLPPIPERSRLDTLRLEAKIQNGTQLLDCTTNESNEVEVLSGITPSRYRWTNFHVFMESNYTSDERTLINNAMDRLSKVLPCVKFGILTSKPSSGDYINIQKGTGCWSGIGKKGGAQNMSLASPGCMSVGTIMHEMIHALGFHHEQCRPDRDDFVTVQLQNVQPGLEHNFKKYSSSEVSTFGVAYDQKSIMHYSSKAFSKNGQPTMIAKSFIKNEESGSSSPIFFKLKHLKTLKPIILCIFWFVIKVTLGVVPNNLALPHTLLPEYGRINTSFLEFLLNPNGTELDCTTEEVDVADTKSGLTRRRYRWTDFNVLIANNYDSAERSLINNAMYKLSQVLPCVKFGIWPDGSNPSGDYVHIKKAVGCWSAVGRQGGVQELSLQSPECMSMRTILHELIHALGFSHEQNRPDRDEFVTVMWQNIQSGKEHNFIKRNSKEVRTFGVSYDQRSIMHYSSRSFSSNGKPTIIAKNGGKVGSLKDLRKSDIKKLKRMYNC
ncbi:Zinc metalloproteinase nas-7 [Orchesella cincta]|uniref:Metalloendopeptidase n=1 Tax=Orchesella cincta TaxID=48709 RepID=A0A1D2N4X2_ORCCI|nr:Zinc metalloproteinase nas-7 [Orchesella cincta]